MYLLSSIPAISIKSATVFTLFGYAINSAMLGMFVVNLILLAFGIYIYKSARIIPTKLQVVFESIYDFFLANLVSSFGSKQVAAKFLPLILTLFLSILVANQFSLIPLLSELHVASAGASTSLFSVPTADFSLPISMALFVVILSHIIALRMNPIKHISNTFKLAEIFSVRSFKDLGNLCLELFLGILDIVGEFAKVISLSARLFGNVLAGELMVLIITYIAIFTTYFVPIPFIFLSIFSGVIQAIIFPLLTVQYLAGMVESVKN